MVKRIMVLHGKELLKAINFPVHTMGFGQYTKINSEMIFDISKAFNGMNGYIPDPTCIGTVFVNAIANILTTKVLDVKLTIGFNDKVGNKFK